MEGTAGGLWWVDGGLRSPEPLILKGCGGYGGYRGVKLYYHKISDPSSHMFIFSIVYI